MQRVQSSRLSSSPSISRNLWGPGHEPRRRGPHRAPLLLPRLCNRLLRPEASAETQQTQSPDPAKTGAGATGSIFGAIALITGSTVGAGMLALPSVTAPAGFGPTATALTAMWALLTVESLLIAEVNLRVSEGLTAEGGSGSGADDGRIVTMRQMAEATLGPSGKGAFFSLLFSFAAGPFCLFAAGFLHRGFGCSLNSLFFKSHVTPHRKRKIACQLTGGTSPSQNHKSEHTPLLLSSRFFVFPFPSAMQW
jgi:hypothetical protein